MASTATTKKITPQALRFWIDNNQNVLFEGKHGVGKTAMVKQAFETAGLKKWKYFSAATMDPWCDFIGMTRAGVARTFLQYCNDRQGVEYIVMMDNDEAVPWDAPYRLAQWGKDIVSGVVCSFSVKKGGVFACFTMADKYGSGRFPSVKHSKRMPAKGLVEAVHAGTGLLCVHRRVFEAIFASGEYPFMISEEVRRHCAATGSLTLGEDMTFSEQAKRCGFKTYVDLSVKVDHYKTMIVRWPEDQVDPSLEQQGMEGVPRLLPVERPTHDRSCLVLLGAAQAVALSGLPPTR